MVYYVLSGGASCVGDNQGNSAQVEEPHAPTMFPHVYTLVRTVLMAQLLLNARKKVDNMKNTLARHIISLHPVPLFAVILASIASVILLLMHFMEMGWQLWLVAILILLAWSPIFFYTTRALYQQYRWLAFFFVLLVAQSVHFTEHIAQMVQIHLLGLSGSQAHGIIGVLDFEWTHFLFDAGWVPICAFTLFFVFRKSNPWLWVLLPIVTWHAAEHVAIMSYYFRTGVVGSPGLLAHGGAIAGGLPLTRPDLHFLYNLLEETLIVLAYLHQIKQIPAGNKLLVSAQEQSSQVEVS